MARPLKELSILNMRLQDISMPNLLFERYPADSSIIPKIIFSCGRNLFIESLIERDEIANDRWRTANNHVCLINSHVIGDSCWCYCITDEPECRCACFHIFHLLIDRIEEEHGPLNRAAKLKIALARPSF